jgi:hypothetical protein
VPLGVVPEVPVLRGADPGTDGVGIDTPELDCTSVVPAVSGAFEQPAAKPMVRAPRAASAGNRFTRFAPVLVASPQSSSAGRARQ